MSYFTPTFLSDQGLVFTALYFIIVIRLCVEKIRYQSIYPLEYSSLKTFFATKWSILSLFRTSTMVLSFYQRAPNTDLPQCMVEKYT
jgi:hypothetical protein